MTLSTLPPGVGIFLAQGPNAGQPLVLCRCSGDQPCHCGARFCDKDKIEVTRDPGPLLQMLENTMAISDGYHMYVSHGYLWQRTLRLAYAARQRKEEDHVILAAKKCLDILFGAFCPLLVVRDSPKKNLTVTQAQALTLLRQEAILRLWWGDAKLLRLHLISAANESVKSLAEKELLRCGIPATKGLFIVGSMDRGTRSLESWQELLNGHAAVVVHTVPCPNLSLTTFTVCDFDFSQLLPCSLSTIELPTVHTGLLTNALRHELIKTSSDYPCLLPSPLVVTKAAWDAVCGCGPDHNNDSTRPYGLLLRQLRRQLEVDRDFCTAKSTYAFCHEQSEWPALGDKLPSYVSGLQPLESSPQVNLASPLSPSALQFDAQELAGVTAALCLNLGRPAIQPEEIMFFSQPLLAEQPAADEPDELDSLCGSDSENENEPLLPVLLDSNAGHGIPDHIVSALCLCSSCAEAVSSAASTVRHEPPILLP